MAPKDAVSKHFRLTPLQARALYRLGITTIETLLRHFPTRYEHAGASAEVNRLVPGRKAVLVGQLHGLKARKLWRSRRAATEGWFEDTSGRVRVIWFNQPYIASYVAQRTPVKISGVVGGSAERPYIANPEVEMAPADASLRGMFETSGDRISETTDSLFPIYPETRGVTSRWFYHALNRVFASGTIDKIEDPIPLQVRERYHLPSLSRALLAIHRPEKIAHAEAARKRFAFEEIFAIQIARARERAENDSATAFPIHNAESSTKKFISSLDIVPTAAQQRAIKEIAHDIAMSHPMARLLEGDVGSGKTLVAAATAYAVVNARPPGRKSGTLQVAYMAPTEILAAQHFESFIAYFRHLPISIALITGSSCKKFPSKVSRARATGVSRSQLLSWVANGEIAMLIGTHALIQKSVRFQHLAYVIVDEQHRFGVRQRQALVRKENVAPHFLSMTATPIPRTLALAFYGDLDLSILDELPPGRAHVETTLLKPDEREVAYRAVREEVESGRQAFVICPRIEEPDPARANSLQAKSAKAEVKRLAKEVFPHYEIGLLHGAMKPKEKDRVMARFASGTTQILVATSVVEVGINVPNATVMLIEGAERFGLAQLHQLRGRIMRSSHPPRCFLLPETVGRSAMKRLRALETSDNGFKLAEADLEARGAGDLLGKRQWGMSDLGMEALKNIRLIRAARAEADAIIKSDPSLAKHPALAARVAATAHNLHTE